MKIITNKDIKTSKSLIILVIIFMPFIVIAFAIHFSSFMAKVILQIIFEE